MTDDPEPVEFRHWEVYISSMTVRVPSESSGTLPHVEVNYGPAPNLQVHVILSNAFSRQTGESTTRGLGDTELGVRYRFVQETKRRPMVGIFPLVEVPSGNAAHGLGSGHSELFFPIWVQKSWGQWTSYGGGGYFINPGGENRSFWLYGWKVRIDLNEHLIPGGELFGTTPDSTTAHGIITNAATAVHRQKPYEYYDISSPTENDDISSVCAAGYYVTGVPISIA